jgi:adenine/guanine/hypoxanthine permease
MKRSFWMPRLGDINGTFGLLVDNMAALVLLYTLLAAPDYRASQFRAPFVVSWLIPGTVLGVLLGGMLYAGLAYLLAKRTGRSDVTAMPVGLDTPSVFAMALFVLLPALKEGRELLADRNLAPLDHHELASVFAWHVGAAVVMMVGVFKIVLAPAAALLVRWLPRGALLGSLAAVALALIAFLPMARHIAPGPIVGLPVLAVILVTMLSRRGTERVVPGSVVALVLGFAIVVAGVFLGDWCGVGVVPMPEQHLMPTGTVSPLSAEVWTGAWWHPVLLSALHKLPIALPFALFTVIGGVQCAASASEAGDEYDARGVILVQGVASAFAGLFGGVVQSTPYFGHPAYKSMGAGWAYVILGSALLAMAGFFGWFAYFFESVPGAVVFPVIVFIGLRTIAHSCESMPRRDYAAMALAAIPVLAYLVVISCDEIFAGRTPSLAGVAMLGAMRSLGNGFILTSILWAATLIAVMDDRPLRAVLTLLTAAACSLFSLIHSPLPGGSLAWPHQTWQELVADPNTRLQYLSPFHWAAAYLLAAAVIYVNSLVAARPAGEAGVAEERAEAAVASGKLI